MKTRIMLVLCAMIICPAAIAVLDEKVPPPELMGCDELIPPPELMNGDEMIPPPELMGDEEVVPEAFDEDVPPVEVI